MKIRPLPALAGLVLLLLFLLASAPARLLGLVLPGEQVSLQGLSGTLWRGGAARAVAATPAGYLQLGAVSWRLHPWSLLLFRPTLDLRSAWGAQEAAGRLTLRGERDLDLKNFDAALSAELLRQVLPVELGGTLSVQVARLALRDGLPVSGQGRLVWQDAVWKAPRGRQPLGSYGLDFEQARGEPLRGTVVTIDGPVRAEGSVGLDSAGYRVDLTIRSEGGLGEELSQALALLAQPLPAGGFRLQLEGAL